MDFLRLTAELLRLFMLSNESYENYQANHPQRFQGKFRKLKLFQNCYIERCKMINEIN